MPTPIRRQYLDIKRRYPHAIVFFRMGDFYETFDDDAKLVADELEITLTTKPMGKGLRVPLAGVPYHSIDGHLSRLIAKGYKVAICEQTSDPATSKGLVDREVVRVVTPGTVVDGGLLDERANNYLVALVPPAARAGTNGHRTSKRTVHGAWDDPHAAVGIAYADVSTGEFVAGEIAAAALQGELVRLRPAEVLVPEEVAAPEGIDATITHLAPDGLLVEVAEAALREHFGVASTEAFGLAGQPGGVAAAGALLQYLRENQSGMLQHITTLTAYRPEGHMALDAASRRNLELFAGGRAGRREHSLLGVLDLTETAMGARLLTRRVGQPLVELAPIDARLDLVAYFHESAVRRGKTRELLDKVPDLERLVGRVVAGVASPRDLVGLRRGIELTPELRSSVTASDTVDVAGAMAELVGRLRPCEEVSGAIAEAIAEEPGATLEFGDVVRAGFHSEMDELRKISKDTKQYLAELETSERERTGIKSLRIGYNKVFGYYIEVSKANVHLVPDDYDRRQTLVGGERYITSQLKEYESRILNARERIIEIETQVFRQVCAQVAEASAQVLALAQAVAELDVAAALAEAASRYNYARPELHEGDEIEIQDGRHAVVERTLAEAPAAAGLPYAFVPNDTKLSNSDAQIVILTGPNMAGKSTYLRQVALIVLMAQIGSFVPADSARIGLVDRIFTRVGAQDDLASGQSTFMVEMLETANILHNATPKSLIILDEIGRGTSTYDGMAIARAVVEYLHNRSEVAAKVLFATHYHELVELADVLPRVRNENVAVAEEGGEVVFLHKIVPGGADRSYGVHVAQMAGLPKAVTQRADELLATLESGSARLTTGGAGSRSKIPEAYRADQLPLPSAGSGQGMPWRPALLDELSELDVDAMSPLEALTKLYELRERAGE
ncbi:MAG: DNA mismatch repair protein MutS [Chloroflexi bacterium]|nr:DNA mismatch repair protein MutS [Chloroflexota bacterium]